eukprot:scaffold47057_cov18-Tisochrysis_lutea.AAC.1
MQSKGGSVSPHLPSLLSHCTRAFLDTHVFLEYTTKGGPLAGLQRGQDLQVSIVAGPLSKAQLIFSIRQHALFPIVDTMLLGPSTPRRRKKRCKPNEEHSEACYPASVRGANVSPQEVDTHTRVSAYAVTTAST